MFTLQTVPAATTDLPGSSEDIIVVGVDEFFALNAPTTD